VHALRPWEPPRLYSWSIVDTERGMSGVTDEHSRAVRRASDALRVVPAGARGLIHLVTPCLSRIGYVYERLVSRGLYNPATDTVVWEPAARCRRSDELGALLADGSDGMPPEAIAAGLADLQAERDRRRALGLPVLPPVIAGR
jgi:hypothetical protein